MVVRVAMVLIRVVRVIRVLGMVMVVVSVWHKGFDSLRRRVT